jgi:mitochondrial fission protein ELM1
MAGFGLAMRQRAKKAGSITQLVHLQDPRLSPDLFDALIVPQHDPARGDKVITMTGSLNRLTLESIRQSMMDLPSKWLVRDAKPTVIVMLGGDNRRYKITDEMTVSMAARLKTFAMSEPMRLVLLPSRRTPPTLIPKLLEGLGQEEDQIEVQTVSPDEPNPYPGILGVADTVIVTADSVNMACEAAIIGKPVLIAGWKIGADQAAEQNLVGETGRIGAFHQTMIAAGHTAPLGPNLPRAPFTALDEMPDIVERLLGMLKR